MDTDQYPADPAQIMSRIMSIRDSFNKARTIVKPWLVPSVRLSGYAKIPKKLTRYYGGWIKISTSDKKPICIK